MSQKFFINLVSLVSRMLIAIEDASDRDSAIKAKEEWFHVIATAVIESQLGADAEVEVIDKLILEKEE